MKESRCCRALAGFTALFLVFSAGNSIFAEAASYRDVAVLAHAGGAKLGPDNTLSAFRCAKEAGADGLEADIQMTKDQHLVLCHDDSIDGTSSGQGKISEMTLEELKTLDFGSWFGEEYAGEKILTLEEALSAAEELDFSVLNLELKPTYQDPAAYIRLAADTIRGSGMADRVIVSSFDHKLLKDFKEYAPEVPAAILTVPNLSAIFVFNLSEFFPREKPLSDYNEEDVKNLPEILANILAGFGAHGSSPEEIYLTVSHSIAEVCPPGITWVEAEALIREQSDLVSYVDSLDFSFEYIGCHYNTLKQELTEAMAEKGIGIYVWTPDKKPDLEKSISVSPDGIITNEPELAVQLRETLSADPGSYD